jgi:acetophenone carboxylase
MTRIRVTEYVDLEVEDERWRCRVCEHDLGSARESYKHAARVHQRDPREVHNPVIEGEYTFAPDPAWVRIVEFYCPGCSTQVDTEYLPPGHPLTDDIQIDIDRLKARLAGGDLRVVDDRVVPAGAAERGGAPAQQEPVPRPGSVPA